MPRRFRFILSRGADCSLMTAEKESKQSEITVYDVFRNDAKNRNH